MFHIVIYISMNELYLHRKNANIWLYIYIGGRGIS